MSCSHSANCPLFAQFAMEPALAIWKQHFCDGEHTKCARYQLGLKGQTVPITLLPNGKMIEHKVKSKEEMGGTALFNAIMKNRASMVKSMFASNMATPNIVANDGSTPLMAAANIGSLEIVNILLEAGCNPFIENKAGIKAIDVAQRKNFPECETALREFMTKNPHLAKQANVVAENNKNTETEEQSEMKGIVSLLKKLNPFSR